VDVSGMSQGKGFAGVIKRHHFSSNRASHGNSLSTNKPGSTGMAGSGPGLSRQRMAGHLGAYNAPFRAWKSCASTPSVSCS